MTEEKMVIDGPSVSVHQNKKEAVIQLCNFVCTKSVSSVHDLHDGKILLQTIRIRFPSYSNDYLMKEDNEGILREQDNEDITKEKEDSEYILKKEDKSSENKYPATEEHILLRYNYMQKFIDDHYEIKSADIISYDDCSLLYNELEIIKVAVFVLSEIIKQLLENNSQEITTLFHLEIKFQVELEEIFKLFISERKRITKNSVEKLLSESAEKMSPYVTPRRSSARIKVKRSISPATPKEDIFTNSPLKAYFESPSFRKEALRMKKEINSLVKTMDEEEEESSKQHYRLLELEEEILKKDKHNKQLEKDAVKMKEEIEFLKSLYESSQMWKESAVQEQTKLKRENHILTSEVEDLYSALTNAENEKMELQKQLKDAQRKRRKFCSHKHEKSSVTCPPKIDETLKQENVAIKKENELQKEKIQSLELKISALKRQLSHNLLTQINENNSPDSPKHGEILAKSLETDCKDLYEQVIERESTIKKLLEEVDYLKEQILLLSKNQKPEKQKEVCSIATMTIALNMPDLIDTSNIPETERLRVSFNQSRTVEHCLSSDDHSYLLNNSENHLPCEQSSVSVKSPSPCPEKTSEAVLWKMYESDDSDTQNTYDYVASENSHLAVNDLRVNDIKIENTEQEGIWTPENKYVLGNLSFDVFFSELKKLTKNGSFKKVLQVFGKRQKEINGTNRSSRLDLEEILNVITECLCVVVSLNAESSFANLQDKCCSTEENEFYNLELNKLKFELQTANDLHKFELDKHKLKIKELEQKLKSLEFTCQEYNQKISENRNTIEEQKEKIKMLSQECKKARTEQSILLSEIEKRKMYMNTFRQDYYGERSQRRLFEKRLEMSEKKKKSLEEENQKLKKENQKLEFDIQKLEKKVQIFKGAFQKLEERKNELKEEDFRCRLSEIHFRRQSVGVPCSSYSTAHEWRSSTANESLLSGASTSYKNLSHSQYISENEEDFFNVNSLNTIDEENKDDDESKKRVEEIKRRNSFYPAHLRSVYPTEGDLPATDSSFLLKDGQKDQEQQPSKRLKTDDPMELRTPWGEFIFPSPQRMKKKPVKMFELSPSLKKLMAKRKKTGFSHFKSKP